LIEEGRNISFIFSKTESWKKGEIVKITSDSIFVKQLNTKNKAFAKGYDLSDFRMMAYNTPLDTYGRGAAVVLLTVTAVAIVVISGDSGVDPWFDDDNKNSKAKKKSFKKNVVFDEGWSAEIVLCE